MKNERRISTDILYWELTKLSILLNKFSEIIKEKPEHFRNNTLQFRRNLAKTHFSQDTLQPKHISAKTHFSWDIYLGFSHLSFIRFRNFLIFFSLQKNCLSLPIKPRISNLFPSRMSPSKKKFATKLNDQSHISVNKHFITSMWSQNKPTTKRMRREKKVF